jgi:hypothetical protein
MFATLKPGADRNGTPVMVYRDRFDVCAETTFHLFSVLNPQERSCPDKLGILSTICVIVPEKHLLAVGLVRRYHEPHAIRGWAYRIAAYRHD